MTSGSTNMRRRTSTVIRDTTEWTPFFCSVLGGDKPWVDETWVDSGMGGTNAPRTHVSARAPTSVNVDMPETMNYQQDYPCEQDYP